MKSLASTLFLVFAATGAFAQSSRDPIAIQVVRDAAPGPSISVSITTLNTPRIALKISAVPRRALWDEKTRTGRLVRTIQVNVAGGRQGGGSGEDRWAQRQINLPPLPPGAYVLSAGKASALVNITGLAIVSKAAPGQHLVWATRLKDGSPAAGAKATLIDSAGRASALGAVNSQGVLLAKAPAQPAKFLLVEHRQDAAVIQLEAPARDQSRSHLLLDRALVRPGDEVNGRIAVRNFSASGSLSTPSAEELTIEVSNPLGILLSRQRVLTNAFGSAPFRFRVSPEAATGSYVIVASRGSGEKLYSRFDVEEYRKPEFKAVFSHNTKRLLAGDKLSTTLDVETYFGAKVPGAQVIWKATLAGARPLPRFDANISPDELYRSPELLAQGAGITDINGRVSILMEAPLGISPGTVEIEAVIIDSANRQITAATSLPVFPGSLLVSGQTLDSYVPLGRLFRLEVNLRTPEGKPAAGDVAVSAGQQVYDAKRRTWSFKALVSQTVKVPASGSKVVDLPARAQGMLEIRLQAKDSAGRPARAVESIYVTDPFAAPEKQPKEPVLRVLPKTGDVKPGGTIQAFVEASVRRPVLVVLEGSQIYGWRVITKPGDVAFPAAAAMHPVVELTATQFASTELRSTAPVRVTDPSKQLVVKATPSSLEVEPGSKVSWRVQTSLGSGKAVAAEVALAVVDQALLDISDSPASNPYESFYGYWPSRTITQSSLPMVFEGGAFQDRGRMAASGVPGGLGGQAPIRQNFADVAAWVPSLVTGPDGSAELSVTLPDNLTTWKATASGLTKDTAAGQGGSSIKATRPLALRLAAPRQVSPTDQLTLRATVNNRSDKDRSLKVRLTVNGAWAEMPVNVAAGSQASADFPIAAGQQGSLTLLGELIGETGAREDGVQLTVPVRTGGVPERLVRSGRAGEEPVRLDLPAGRVRSEGRGRVSVYAGPGAFLSRLRKQVLDAPRWSPIVAAAQLALLADNPKNWQDPDLQAVYGVLSGSNSGMGWGAYEGAPVDYVATSRIAIAVYEARGIAETGQKFLDYTRANVTANPLSLTADASAFLVLAQVQIQPESVILEQSRAMELQDLASPTAKLALAEALLLGKKPDLAEQIIAPLLASVSRGQSASFLPSGDALGWTGSTLEATLRLLRVLRMTDREPALRAELAQWVMDDGLAWSTPTEQSLAVQELRQHFAKAPGPSKLGPIQVLVNGKEVPVTAGPNGDWAEAAFSLAEGSAGADSQLAVEVKGAQGARFEVDAISVMPVDAAGGDGIKTLFRWEVQTASGGWAELDRAIRPGEPVRCTAVVWGDAVADLVKVTLPIPAGFEMVDFESSGGRQEVRDGAIVYYTVASDGLPNTFRFYLRAESEGEIRVAPAVAEVVRRPQRKGWSSPMTARVKR